MYQDCGCIPHPQRDIKLHPWGEGEVRPGAADSGGQEGQPPLLEKSRRGKTTKLLYLFAPPSGRFSTPTTCKLVSANRELGAFYWFLDIKNAKKSRLRRQ